MMKAVIVEMVRCGEDSPPTLPNRMGRPERPEAGYDSKIVMVSAVFTVRNATSGTTLHTSTKFSQYTPPQCGLYSITTDTSFPVLSR